MSRWTRAGGALGAALAVFAIAPGPHAVAQVTAPGPPPTTAAGVGVPAPVQAAPPVPEAPDEVPDDPPPADVLPPPPPPGPPPEPTPDQTRLRAAIAARLVDARGSLAQLETWQASTRQRLDGFAARVAGLEATVARLRAETTVARRRVADSDASVRRWGVHLYTAGSLGPLEIFLDVDGLATAPRRLGLTTGAFDAAQQGRRVNRAGLAALRVERSARSAELDRARLAADEARRSALEADLAVDAWRRDIAALSAGQDIAVVGMVFPVAAASTFADSFGAPRMTGTPFAHAHQGVDIFALRGAPIVAIERGVLARVGTDRLGGTKLWLVGQSGTRYYYAHLDGYAPGVADGVVVVAGQMIATVGSTGNARATPPHLHFEIRPGGGDAVNPYPVLRQVVDLVAVSP